MLQVVNGPRPRGARRPWRWWRRTATLTGCAVVLFAGTLVFAINLVDSFIGDLTPGPVRPPGLVAGHGRLRPLPRLRPPGDGRASPAAGCPAGAARDLGWWIVAVNQLGSVLFMVSAVASFVRADGDMIAVGIANWGTLTGALCFAVAGLMQEFEQPGLRGCARWLVRHERTRRGRRRCCRGSGGCGCRCPGRGSRTATPGRSQRGDGIVLFDTGMGGKGRLRQLDLALAQAGFGVEDVGLLVCTHSHTDHYGLAAPIVEAAGCELWMHPAWEHVRLLADDPAAALEQRLEVARQSGVPVAALERYRESRESDEETGIDAIQSSPTATSSPGSRWRPTSAPGRSTRPPATPPRTSSSTSPSAS